MEEEILASHPFRVAGFCARDKRWLLDAFKWYISGKPLQVEDGAAKVVESTSSAVGNRISGRRQCGAGHRRRCGACRGDGDSAGSAGAGAGAGAGAC